MSAVRCGFPAIAIRASGMRGRLHLRSCPFNYNEVSAANVHRAPSDDVLGHLQTEGDERMAEIIQGIFCDPPVAIARLGGSTTPVVAYTWRPSPDPRSEGDTVIAPDW